MSSGHPEPLRRDPFIRLTFIVSAIFIGVFATTALIGWGVVREALHARVTAETRAGLADLVDRFEMGGPESAASFLSTRLNNGRVEHVAGTVVDPEGAVVGGVALILPSDDGFTRRSATDLNAKIDEDIFFVGTATRDRYRLAYAYSFDEADAIGTLVAVTFGVSTFVATLAAIGGALTLSRGFRRRLRCIESAFAAAAGGDFTARADVIGKHDALDALAESTNRSIGDLGENMARVKRVTDDIAHELRTPIGRTLILIEEAQRQTVDANSLGRLAEAHRELLHLAGTFDSLLTIAQIENRNRRDRYGILDLRDIATRVYEAFDPVADAADHCLRLEVSSEAVCVKGDEDLLLRVLANLLENAIRHTNSGTAIVLRATSAADNAQLIVTDNGHGIPADDCERMTERFARLSPERAPGGTGLGLALVKAVAIAHDGTLLLDDANPGLRVTLTIPLVR
ncbi:hypothetical protein PB2503_00490 [Parvularcula bermudensis HTCC2503]|uniref:histidine kinase n=1 Tax=Parvularcula bermudensis (strain ATCC BAA-594 / HTCC2503 / KCTC 12087) TaxID=314260 RepID=E0TIK7_PARBH|nr:HAMP domain-containing sensor histidine kinase [Parvularcula bermudensis]ADM10865.1 hypothetical protein PB2503_00490 [Parvularcula bermudensis HTCC2503]